MASRIKEETKRFLNNFFKVIKRPDMVLLPGNLSFFFVLAIVPTVALITYTASILNLNTSLIYEFLSNRFSESVANIVLGVSFTGMSGFKFAITIIIGLYIASNGADCIITTSNAIYGIDNKSWIKRRLKAICMTFLLIFLFILILIIQVFGNTIVDILSSANLSSHIIDPIVFTFKIVEGPITWLVIFFIIKLLYSIAPDRNLKQVNYGAIFTTIMWILGTTMYAYYATNFASYAALYGGIANVIILMIWMYFLCYVFTIGIALNYREEKRLEKNGSLSKE